MKKIIVVGAGGHAAEIHDYFQYAKNKNINFDLVLHGFIDDNPLSYKNYYFTAPFLGDISRIGYKQIVFISLGSLI